jgi:hypothetical protein
LAPVDRPRYRRVSSRVWNDEKFDELSKAKPNAQTLWFWLLTGPLTTAIPGLIPAGVATMAERLNWPLAATRQAWGEIAARGMAVADFKAPLIWLPKAVRHNPPESPNVVRSWRRVLATDIPPSPVARQAEAYIAAFLERMGPAFAEAFAKGIPASFPESGSGTGSGSTTPPSPRAAGGKPPTRKELEHANAELAAWKRDHAPWSLQEIRAHQAACERNGEPVLEVGDPAYDGGPSCWHVPPCEDLDVCRGRIVGELRAKRAQGLTLAEGATA